MSSYNKANLTLQKLCESQKQAIDTTGLVFNDSEFCEGETITQSCSAYDKFNKMSFVKADMIYNCLESMKYDNQNSPKLNENGKAGIGFSKPESFKPNWLKNRLDKDKAKASPKPFVLNQSWHNSKKVKSDDEDNERNVEKSKDNSKDKYKERSSDRKMKTNNNKRFSRKHDRKALVAEESTKSWADSDSDSSSSSSSSSESEQEEVHCFMADQTDEDEVFDFSNVEFTRDDLVIALNDMVKEYRKLSHSFEEAKAENMSLKSSSAESSSVELEDFDILKTELSKLQAENELL
ncbi:Serine/threonine protein phosphatase 6 regulatory ankyrin repeat subunit C [Dorcoceras hygrometricum]|uniref:Serine/threonine protein phosphatase 6 regulatory ankyrin repeat subunit C n=1 Tax=Dorcoceras hygrometricum TaxID=472368 RepID=A0A2Z7ATY5_9LAMI|nr:Serine/threonine protein phosphatase 6 regulatory ankyrin repeat subunit C [Dorcoceras hygrometricum]